MILNGLPLITTVETAIILVRAETGTGERVTVSEAILAFPRLFVAHLPHHDARTVGMMLDDILTRTTSQLDGRVQRRVVGLARKLDEFLYDTLLLNN